MFVIMELVASNTKCFIHAHISTVCSSSQFIWELVSANHVD